MVYTFDTTNNQIELSVGRSRDVGGGAADTTDADCIDDTVGKWAMTQWRRRGWDGVWVECDRRGSC